MAEKKITFKLPDELIQAISSHAAAMGKSRTSVIVNLLEYAFGLPQDELPQIKTVLVVEEKHENQLKELTDLKARFNELEKQFAIQAEQIAELRHVTLFDSNIAQLVTALSTHLIGSVKQHQISVQQAKEVKPESTNVFASHYVQVNNFLTPEERNRLLDYVLQKESAFVSTTTTTDTSALDYRRSMALYSFPEFSELIINRIQEIIPNILQELKLPLFSVSQIETQLTAHNDGNYYKVHNDNGNSEVANRELSYVYYFHRQPKPFSGGELLIYDSKIENNFYIAAESFKAVEPRDNSIVFFLSRYMHEILPVSCPSQVFADSRFTINGWIRR